MSKTTVKQRTNRAVAIERSMVQLYFSALNQHEQLCLYEGQPSKLDAPDLATPKVPIAAEFQLPLLLLAHVLMLRLLRRK